MRYENNLIEKGEQSAVATKLMALMSLGVKCGEEITVQVEGDDEDTACAGIKEFIEANM